MPAWIPAAIGAAATLIGGAFGNRSRKKESKRQRNWNEDMWNRQNAYNTPSMQMQRLKDAGLNPALMYGQGNVGNAEKVQGYQQPQIENIGAGMAQSAAAGAQLSLVNAQKKNIEADTANKEQNTILQTEQAANLIASTLNINAQRAKTIQETLNLKQVGKILEFDKAIKQVEADRAQNKGIIKGDTIGNLLSILNLDPKNNPNDRTLLQTAFTAYFGAKIARDILSGIGSAKGKTVKNVFEKGSKNVRNYKN